MKERGELAENLDTKTTAQTPQTFPNGCHIAEVEIDPETGEVAILAYTAVDDCGNVLSHMIVQGQIHGALARLGQALLEHAIYDAEGGQLITGSFMDYAMPRATDMPALRDALHPVPATTNPLGVKGVGEAATTAAIATVMSAIDDAIRAGRRQDGDAGDACESVGSVPEGTLRWLQREPHPTSVNHGRHGVAAMRSPLAGRALPADTAGGDPSESWSLRSLNGLHVRLRALQRSIQPAWLTSQSRATKLAPKNLGG
jgi:hypothetical protein